MKQKLTYQESYFHPSGHLNSQQSQKIFFKELDGNKNPTLVMQIFIKLNMFHIVVAFSQISPQKKSSTELAHSTQARLLLRHSEQTL